jgi:hypothetical protein
MSVKPVHSPGVEKYQYQESIDRTLLGEPETQFVTTY